MFARLRRNLVEKNYAPVALELLVVVFGILIAFQIDRWAKDRREREEEYEYLVRLKEDLQFENSRMDRAHDFAQSRIDAAMLLEEIVANPSIAEDQLSNLPWALETAGWRSFPQIDAIVFSELQNSGNLALIGSVSLRRDLANHYTSIRHEATVGLDLTMQHLFDRLTAGILSTSEVRAIEDGSWQETPQEVSADRAAEIADELARRQDAIDLIPSLVQHHIFTQKVVRKAREDALNIIDHIDSLIEDFDR